MSEPDAFKISEAVIDLWRCYTIERDMEIGRAHV